MSEHILTPEERGEYESLLYDAGYDDAGKPRPSYEIGRRVVDMLREAAGQAHREWARWILDDLAVAGGLRRWRTWSKARDVVTVAGKSYTVTKPAAVGVRKRSVDGRTYYQATLWDDMTREELEQVIARSAKQIDSEGKTIATAKRLLSLMSRIPEASTVAEASAALGITTEAYLAAIDEAA